MIAGLGEGVEGFSVGERVVSETAFSYCGTCESCREGWYNLCPERRTLGYWYNGIFTNYTVVPAGRVHRIPDNVSDIAAAMTEPLACVCHAVFDLTVISPTDLVLVSGPGPIGLMAMSPALSAPAKAAGCRPWICSPAARSASKSWQTSAFPWNTCLYAEIRPG